MVPAAMSARKVSIPTTFSCNEATVCSKGVLWSRTSTRAPSNCVRVELMGVTALSSILEKACIILASAKAAASGGAMLCVCERATSSASNWKCWVLSLLAKAWNPLKEVKLRCAGSWLCRLPTPAPGGGP